MKFELPEYVGACLSKLKENGFDAYCVGGAVRDHLLGIFPDDYDVATSATPEQVIGLFDKTVPTGIKHGTVTVVTAYGNIEVTTFRSDGDYTDSRHPDSVLFVGDIKSDLERRDFTVNAIGYDGYDFVSVEDSFYDLKGKIIRAVGDPERRFSEDALRIMRCFRFAAQLGFEIEQATLLAALKKPDALRQVSAERIATELIKTVCSDHPERANRLFTSGMLEFLGLKKGELSSPLSSLEKSPETRLAAAFYMLKSEPKGICSSLKFSNKLTEEICLIYEMLCKPICTSRSELKMLLQGMDISLIKQVLAARDILFGEDNGNTKKELESIIASGEPYTLKMLKIGGNELISLGFKGTQIGEVLNHLLSLVINDSSLNTKEKLLEISKDIL